MNALMSSHQRSRKCRALYRLLSLILPDRIGRRLGRRQSPSISLKSIDGPFVSKATRYLNASKSNCDSEKHRVTINILPDDVLLHIFHFDRVTHLYGLRDVEQLRRPWRWHRLVHVCRGWRSIVFASPNFLNLRLVCGPSTRVELTGIWPPLPIIIRNADDWNMPEDYDFDAAVVHPSRVFDIYLVNLTSSQLQRFASAAQEQFPALIYLKLGFDVSDSRPAPVLQDGFLGGSTPRLRSLRLHSIPLPALPKLLLSATHLVRLSLRSIPHSGYISPEAIVTGLAVLANLESLTVGFESPLSRPVRENRRPPPLARTVLPALTRFEFKGVSEWLEDLVARIDAPLLDLIQITFFHQLIFDIPRLAQFMRRMTRFQTLNEAHVDFDDDGVQVRYLTVDETHDEVSRPRMFGLRICCRELDWQLSSLAQVLPMSFPFIDLVEHLYIYRLRDLPSHWKDDVESMQWLEIFLPLTAVKNLYVSLALAPCIAPALQELIAERVADVLPALECLFLEELPSSESGPVEEAIGQFVAARQLLGQSVAVSRWNASYKT